MNLRKTLLCMYCTSLKIILKYVLRFLGHPYMFSVQLWFSYFLILVYKLGKIHWVFFCFVYGVFFNILSMSSWKEHFKSENKLWGFFIMFSKNLSNMVVLFIKLSCLDAISVFAFYTVWKMSWKGFLKTWFVSFQNSTLSAIHSPQSFLDFTPNMTRM